MNPDRAWDLGLDEYLAMNDVYAEAERAKDYRAGVIAAVLRNAWRGEGDEPVGPEHFFASLEVEDVEPTPEEDAEWFRQLALAMGGTVETKEIAA